MISVVFVIGVLNLLLGFALAVLLERQIVVPFPCFDRVRQDRDVVFEVPVAEPAPLEEMRDKLPKRWLDILDASEVEFATFVEASMEILKLEINSYREDLLDVEDLVISAIAKRKPEAIRDALQELVALNEEWVERLNDALRVMADSRDKLGEYASIGSQLESLLLDQASLVLAECRKMTSLDLKEDDSAPDLIISGIGHLVCMGHELRDVIGNATLRIICNEGRLEPASQQHQGDELTGLQNRMGVETAFKNWWREDDQRQRLICAALIDLDRFGELNNQVSTRVGDRMLKTIAIYLEQLIVSDTGLERVFRFGGQTFFVFFGDSGPRTAASKIEKIRQTIEATKLEHKGQQYRLTVRAGVTEVRRDDDTATLFHRLEELTETAKRAGRNRTGLDDSSGSGILQPESQEVKSRVIRVE